MLITLILRLACWFECFGLVYYVGVLVRGLVVDWLWVDCGLAGCLLILCVKVLFDGDLGVCGVIVWCFLMVID